MQTISILALISVLRISKAPVWNQQFNDALARLEDLLNAILQLCDRYKVIPNSVKQDVELPLRTRRFCQGTLCAVWASLWATFYLGLAAGCLAEDGNVHFPTVSYWTAAAADETARANKVLEECESVFTRKCLEGLQLNVD
ncbi:hypothetical protein K470DRAFT_267066 [Piedraia hortae CBS 480.64]|uniref:Fungal STAND N-terminal Goodbye domain-containing protein n=1 Tax=Piedraia hortae CBS 480.64 TaxID=1314780 RepID=A0A6A7BRI1_9PEZI|nr:hypothetical protein K470DRAFT_267066 [Piedraia hortae CBS 480.64]